MLKQTRKIAAWLTICTVGALYQGPVTIDYQGNKLNLHVEALTSNLVSSSADGSSITMKYGEQTRAFVVGDATSGMVPPNYFNFSLLNTELSYDVDISTVGCSCNAALFFTGMPGYNPDGSMAHGKYNPYYCDANDVGGVWCWEMDSIEANKFSMATTPHRCSADPGQYIPACDGSGCSTNAFFVDPNGMCPDSRCKIDTRRPFRVSQKYEMDPSFSKLIGIQNTLVQDGSVFAWPVSCTDSAYMQEMTKSLKTMKMVFQLWGTNHTRMSWLDNMTGCTGSCNQDSAYVTFSNISITALESHAVQPEGEILM